MAISYQRLWKLLIDNDMKKSDMERAAGISHYTANKLNQNKHVNVDILAKICNALGCTMDDIREILPDEHEQLQCFENCAL